MRPGAGRTGAGSPRPFLPQRCLLYDHLRLHRLGAQQCIDRRLRSPVIWLETNRIPLRGRPLPSDFRRTRHLYLSERFCSLLDARSLEPQRPEMFRVQHSPIEAGTGRPHRLLSGLHGPGMTRSLIEIFSSQRPPLPCSDNRGLNFTLSITLISKD